MIATYIGIAFNIGYWIAYLLAISLMCDPIKAYWLQFDPVWVATHKYHCGDEGVELPFWGSLGVIGDFYSTLIPLLQIRSLEMPRRQKIALYLLFGLGFM